VGDETGRVPHLLRTQYSSLVGSNPANLRNVGIPPAFFFVAYFICVYSILELDFSFSLYLFLYILPIVNVLVKKRELFRIMIHRVFKIVPLFQLLLCLAIPSFSAETSSSSAQSLSSATQSSNSVASSSSTPLPKWQTLPEMKAPWMKGERLEYELSWGFITAGYASLEVKPRNDGKIEFLTYATANKTVNKFYPVHDTVYTLVRKKGLMTDVFRKSLHEGTFHNKSLIRFDRDNKKAFLSDTVFKDAVNHYVKRSADTSVTIGGLEHSIMSAFYLVRTLPLKEGATSRFSAVSGEKRYELKVVIHKREKIKTDLGEFNTVKVEPVLDGDGIFKSSGRIFIWFTDDEKRLPVLMQCEIKLGSIKATLLKVK